MKHLLFILFIYSALSLFFACKHTQYTADKLPDTTLRWGKGGGITGKERSYVLLENGQLFYADGLQAPLLAQKSIKARQADQIIDKVEDSGIDTLHFQHPGNLYQFIELSDDGKKHRVVWGADAPKLPSNIEALYRELMQIGAFK